MSYETIRYQVDRHIATITLNRPAKLNAFNHQMRFDLVSAFDRVDADDDVRAVIVTGEGRAFCAGADISAGGGAFDVGRSEDSPVRDDGSLNYSSEAARDGGGFVSLRIFRCLKPVIAAINGPAVGVGVTMTLPMDIRIASESAKFGLVFARRGIVPEAASSYFLPRVVGISKALEWCYSGRVFSAAEARDGRLVSHVVPAEELLPKAREMAGEIVEQAAPVSIALIRQMMWRGLDYEHPMQAHCIDSRGILWRGRSADVAEGIQSFFARRTPQFTERVSTDMPDFFPWWQEPKFS